ncbi:DUF3253 domain-containing protein [Luteimonas sp. XNQY3]|nr:DUF3253 domain-containing protein [Luteimonas sp. XNQY3]
MTSDDARIAADIRTLLDVRAPDASICPSEVARRLSPEDAWRDAMPDVRRVAVALAADGVIRITQSDVVLDPEVPISGPIRLRRGPRWNDDTPID